MAKLQENDSPVISEGNKVTEQQTMGRKQRSHMKSIAKLIIQIPFPDIFPVLEFAIRRATRICAEGALSRDTVKVWIGGLGVLSIEG